MNIYTKIKRDHDEARSMMDEILEGRNDEQVCLEVLEELKVAILSHAKSEEKTFYEALKESGDEQLSEKVPNFKKEHKEVETMFEEIESMHPREQLWWEKFGAIRQALLHHMEEEEKQVFKAAKQEIESQEASELGEEMEVLEEKMKQRLEQRAA